jgi:hypothetical protein
MAFLRLNVILYESILCPKHVFESINVALFQKVKVHDVTKTNIEGQAGSGISHFPTGLLHNISHVCSQSFISIESILVSP